LSELREVPALRLLHVVRCVPVQGRGGEGGERVWRWWRGEGRGGVDAEGGKRVRDEGDDACHGTMRGMGGVGRKYERQRNA